MHWGASAVRHLSPLRGFCPGRQESQRGGIPQKHEGNSSETRRKFLKNRKALLDALWPQTGSTCPAPPFTGALGLVEIPRVLRTAPHPHVSFPLSALGVELLAVTGRRYG